MIGLLLVQSLLARLILAATCVDDYFCEILIEQVSCYSDDSDDQNEMVLQCPLSCGNCTGTLSPTVNPTLEPTGSPTIEPTPMPSTDPTSVPTEAPTTTPTVEEHDESQDKVILVLMACIMAAVSLGAIFVTCIARDEDDVEAGKAFDKVYGDDSKPGDTEEESSEHSMMSLTDDPKSGDATLISIRSIGDPGSRQADM